jgi:tRNA uridine 5-carboxymethylaminomethyl modification enzyme
MFTSRAEFRLHLRIDNADRRLTPHGRRIGLITDEAWEDFQAKQERLTALKKKLEGARITPAMGAQISDAREQIKACHSEHSRSEGEEPAVARSATTADLSSALGQTLGQLLKRPEIAIEKLVPVLRELTPEFFARTSPVTPVVGLSSEVRNELKSVETEIKYEGYLLQQQRAMDRLKKSELHAIPEWFDYRSISGLSREMQEKLSKVQPRTIGQASRIPGVTAAAVSLVNVFVEIQARRRDQAAAL